MTKKEFFDIVKFHYMSVQNPTCIRWESEDGSVCEEIELRSYYNDGTFDYRNSGKWDMCLDQRDKGYYEYNTLEVAEWLVNNSEEIKTQFKRYLRDKARYATYVVENF